MAVQDEQLEEQAARLLQDDLVAESPGPTGAAGRGQGYSLQGSPASGAHSGINGVSLNPPLAPSAGPGAGLACSKFDDSLDGFLRASVELLRNVPGFHVGFLYSL